MIARKNSIILPTLLVSPDEHISRSGLIEFRVKNLACFLAKQLGKISD
jgi:hypothetical protein